MADFAAGGNYFVYPTRGSAGQGVGGQAYKGSYHSELQLAQLFSALQVSNFIISGFTVPASSADLTLSVALGVAVIDGRVVTVPGATTVTCMASQTNHIFLKLVRDSANYVTSCSYEVNTTGVAPADSIKLCTAVADTSLITSTADTRPFANRGKFARMAVYSSAGTTAFVPQYTGKHLALIIGGGGSGGGGYGRNNTTTNYASGGGGGAGAAVLAQVDVVASISMNVVVGAGGFRIGNLMTLTEATDSSFGGVTANHGISGTNALNATKGTGGAGGAAAAPSQTSFSLAGAAGTDGQDASGGSNRTGGSGGNAPYWAGLKGGVGTNNSTINSGTIAGAGGAGGYGWYASGGSALSDYTAAGNGAPGLVIIFW